MEEQGVQVVTLNISRRSIALLPLFIFDMVKAIVALVLLVRRRQVEIIHAHLPDCAMLGTMVGKLAGIGVVVTYQGLTVFPANRRSADPRQRLRIIMHRLTTKWTDRCIAVSEAIKEKLGQTIQVEPHKVVVIRNGIDVEEYDRPVEADDVLAQLGLQRGEVIVTCVGRLIATKGQDFLIRAAQEVVQHHPNVRFLIVGDGPRRAALADLVAQLRLEEHVRLLGERADVPHLLGITDVFAFPSLTEGFPLAVAEAMAAGKAVVASRIAGVTEIVQDQVTGVLVPPASPAAMAQAIRQLLTDTALAHRMGRRGKERAKQHFGCGQVIEQTARVYDEVRQERTKRATAK
jgi:glycosyltransferase involved in cell wall biosynthesis